MTEREQLQTLVAGLPEEDVHAALRFVTYLRAQQDPLLAAIAPAPGDEEVTEEERAALREAEMDLAAGRTASTDELRRRLASEG